MEQLSFSDFITTSERTRLIESYNKLLESKVITNKLPYPWWKDDYTYYQNYICTICGRKHKKISSLNITINNEQLEWMKENTEYVTVKQTYSDGSGMGGIFPVNRVWEFMAKTFIPIIDTYNCNLKHYSHNYKKTISYIRSHKKVRKNKPKDKFYKKMLDKKIKTKIVDLKNTGDTLWNN